MISSLEPAKVPVAFANMCVRQEPLKVQLPTNRFIDSDFSSRLREAVVKEQHRLLMEQIHQNELRASAEPCHTNAQSFTSTSSESCQSDSPEKKQRTTRSNISELSTNASSFQNQSDNEEGDVCSTAAQTTVVLKNLGQFCTRSQLIELLDANDFLGKYDLVYVPVDFASMRSHCYAFVNFVSEEVAIAFKACAESSHGFVESTCVGEGGCEVSWAMGMQGLGAAIKKYRNSPVMHANVPEECKPLLLENGKMVAFPLPTKKIQKPRGLKR